MTTADAQFQTLARDTPYSPHAFEHVTDSVKSGEVMCCDEFRAAILHYAIMRFGIMAETTFRRWGIHGYPDLGAIFKSLLVHGTFTDEDFASVDRVFSNSRDMFRDFEAIRRENE